MYPSFEQVQALRSDYRRIPLCHELYADRFTPIEVMRTLRAASRHCYLLESAENQSTWGRYSFLGYAPTLELTCQSGTVRLVHNPESEHPTVETHQVEHPGEIIRQILKDYHSPKLEGLPPFTGGLVGYFSYDYIQYAEPSLKTSPENAGDFRDMDLMLFDRVIVFDNYRQKLILIAGIDTADPAAGYASAQQELLEMEQLLTSGAKAVFRPLKLASPLELCFSKEKYMGMVEKARHYIHEGDIFQVVLSNPMEAQAEGSLFDVYRVLRTTNPSPYMFYFSSDDIEVSGASPETLAKLQDGRISTSGSIASIRSAMYSGAIISVPNGRCLPCCSAVPIGKITTGSCASTFSACGQVRFASRIFSPPLWSPHSPTGSGRPRNAPERPRAAAAFPSYSAQCSRDNAGGIGNRSAC